MQHHEACSYCYMAVRCGDQTEPPVEYRGPNAAEHFLKAIQEEERKIKVMLANNAAINCHRCEKPLEGASVPTHCHITEKYRGTTTAKSLRSTVAQPTMPAT